MTEVTWAVGITTVIVGVGMVVLAICRLYYADKEQQRLRQAEKPVCGCGHHASFHQDNGPCKWTRMSDYSRERDECGCQRYYGPPATEWMP